MRVNPRIALVVFVAAVLSATAAVADQYGATCPLTLVATNPAPITAAFEQSPHGVFRFGSQVFALRGGTLTTYNVLETGEMSVIREDTLTSLAARESIGGVAFANGILYVSSEAGLEAFDLRNIRAGGPAPSPLTTRPIAGLRYHRLAVNSTGTLLAALYPATDLPCYANGTAACFNTIDIYNIANPATPVRVSSLSTFAQPTLGGYTDVAFNSGYLIASAYGATQAWDLSTPSAPSRIGVGAVGGTFLVSNGTSLVAVGNSNSILTYAFNVNSPSGAFTPITFHSTANLQTERALPIVFHPQATFDEGSNRLITLIDELDYLTLKPARTIAFDVFDYGTAMLEGRDPRQYEQVSYTVGDEVKWNPLAVGSLVYVVGEMTGTQTYGACGIMTGRIEFDSIAGTVCGGSEIHGWVTGTLRIANVELFLDNTSLGVPVTPGGALRNDIPSTTPVQTWRVSANLDATSRGLHVLRAVGTDVTGQRRQFASVPVFFPGPGSNCVARRRVAGLR